ncbi:MAG: hypothetical protein ACJA1O_003234 [Spirosomataceae bacterium]|jgi:hypothetical protein
MRSLKTNGLFFNSPENFNDPYDCTQSIVLEELSDDLVSEYYSKSFKSERAEELIPKLFDRSISREQYIELFKIIAEKNHGKRDSLRLDQLISEEGLEEDEIFNQQVDDNADTIREMVGRIIKNTMILIRKNMAENHGVCCFSERYDEMLMWSYYADGHSGFCLEFDTSSEPFTKMKKVNYVQNIPSFSPSRLLEGDKDDDFIETFLCTKFEGWKHEREWRVLHQEKGTVYAYESKQLTGIYLGAKINDTDKEIILTLLRSQNPYVKFYEMELVDNSFAVKPREISYFTHLEGQILFLDTIKSVFKNNKFTLNDILTHAEFGWMLNLVNTYLLNLEAQITIRKVGEYYSIISE